MHVVLCLTPRGRSRLRPRAHEPPAPRTREVSDGSGVGEEPNQLGLGERRKELRQVVEFAQSAVWRLRIKP
jgi:hypothetical protein